MNYDQASTICAGSKPHSTGLSLYTPPMAPPITMAFLSALCADTNKLS